MTDPELGGELVVHLLYSRTRAHILHLTTNSYSEHVALQEYYEKIVDLADALAENMQGKVGFLEYDGIEDMDWGEHSKSMLLALRSWIDTHRQDVSDESDVQNQIDEILAQISRTYYKVEMLG